MTARREDEEMSMEDILASIRRYVADDSQESVERLASAFQNSESSYRERPAYGERPRGPSSFESAPEVIHLTERHEAKVTPFVETMEPRSAPDSRREPEPKVVPEEVQTASSDAFSRLSEAVHRKPAEPKPTSTEGSVTLDHLIGELARPMIKQWLDANLPKIVESMVEKEIARIAGR